MSTGTILQLPAGWTTTTATANGITANVLHLIAYYCGTLSV
jgi:hypothetical protein